MKFNPWVWTEISENKKPDRKNGEPVPLGYLSEGINEYYPYYEWVKKGYVRRADNVQ